MTNQNRADKKGFDLCNAVLGLESAILFVYAFSLPLSMTFSWVTFIVGICVSLVSGLLHFGKGQALYAPLSKAPLALVFVIYAAAITVSGAMNPDRQGLVPMLSSAAAALWSLKSCLPYFWAYRILAKRPALAVSSLAVLLFMGAVAGIWGGIQQIFDIHPGYKYLQGTGFMGGPMTFAGQMQMYSMLALGLLLSGGFEAFSQIWPKLQNSLGLLGKKYVFALIVLANLAGLLFAAERSAWLGGFAGVLALAALLSWQAFLSAVAALSLFSTGAYFLLPVVKTRLASLFSGQMDVSLSARLTIWQHSWEILKDKPYFGVGIMNFPHFDIKEAIVPGVSSDLNHGHSNYIHIAACTGIVGLLAFLALHLKMLTTAFGAFRQTRDIPKSGPDYPFRKFLKGLNLGLAGAITSLMVSGLFEYNFGTAQIRLAEWFLLAFLALPTEVYSKSPITEQDAKI